MTTRQQMLDLASRYFRALEQSDRDALEAILHSDIASEERPNRLRPQGGKADRGAMLAAFEGGKSAVRAQRFEIESAVVEGDRAALQVLWSATVDRPFGSLQAGDRMRAHFAVFLEMRGGQVIAQRNYDCFDPF